MGTLPGNANIPARETHIMVTMRQRSVAETPETVKDAMTSGKRRIEPLPWDTRKIPKGTYHVMDTGNATRRVYVRIP